MLNKDIESIDIRNVRPTFDIQRGGDCTKLGSLMSMVDDIAITCLL